MIKEAEMDEKVIIARCTGPCVVKQAEFFTAWPKKKMTPNVSRQVSLPFSHDVTFSVGNTAP